MKLILFIIVMFIYGCGTTIQHEQTFIRDTTYIIIPPEIIDSGKAQIVTDTIIQFIRKDTKDSSDTIVDIRYLPGTKEMFWKIQPMPVEVKVRDTIYKTETVKEITETPFLAKVGLVFFGAVGMAIITIIVLLIKKVIR